MVMMDQRVFLVCPASQVGRVMKERLDRRDRWIDKDLKAERVNADRPAHVHFRVVRALKVAGLAEGWMKG